MIRTVVFDLDGTLVNSAPDLQAAANRMLGDLGHGPIELETVIGFIGNGVEMLVRRCLRHVGQDPQDLGRALALFQGYYARDLTTLTRPYPGVLTLLETLREAGLVLGLCTNKPEKPARDLCQSLDIDKFFQVILGGDTLAVRKPDPAPLRHVVAALGGTAPETLYVGDSETDYLTTRRAGIRFAYFEGGYQRTPIAGFKPDLKVAEMGDLARRILQPTT
ncbi:phosphoglycolate phosphatase [Puniceibacterium sediminis]|uniref:Phosphoglycolate phosphatase n=1 Tax=Puniceibacterium sediminis TaxID=1608407 RepID=A0A238YZC7_9RHOB|nr:phosphoglycolate phosphatase [Puniceibacterium sediminis]SNR75993.1 phosphoglycolate phosphatase [Puniceibacterium sediminis]